MGDQSKSATHQVHHSVDMNTVPVEGNNSVTTCRVSKTLCYDRPAAATGKQIDVHSHRVPSWKITCRTVQVVPECLRQYNTCSALHRRSQGIQLKNPEQTPLTTEWATILYLFVQTQEPEASKLNRLQSSRHWRRRSSGVILFRIERN